MFFKPVTTFLAIILETMGYYQEGSFDYHYGYVYLSFVMNMSVSYAFYWMILLYFTIVEELRPHDPVPKFLCIKTILFLSFWQGVVLAALTKYVSHSAWYLIVTCWRRLQIIHDIGEWTSEDLATGVQNFLICVEMMIISFFHK